MTLGYVVTCKNSVMILDERDGRLYFGATGTLFDKRAKADRAIRRTLVGILNEGRDWNAEFGPLKITRLTEPIRTR